MQEKEQEEEKDRNHRGGGAAEEQQTQRPKSAAAAAASSPAAPVIPGTASVAPISLPSGFKLPSASTNRSSSSGGESPWLWGARWALALSLPGLTERMLAKAAKEESNKGDHSSAAAAVTHAVLTARAAMVRLGVGPLSSSSLRPASSLLLISARSALSRALRLSFDDGCCWECFLFQGHLAYQLFDFNQAQKCYQRVQAWEHTQRDPLLLHRLGSMYRAQGEMEKAKETFLQLCAVFSSCGAWLGVAVCSLAAGDSLSAQSALVQANRFDKSDAGVWARLSLVSLQQGRLSLAHQALLHALHLGCTEQSILAQIASAYSQAGLLSLAAATLDRALQARESVQLRMQIAALCEQQQAFEAAEGHIQQAQHTLSSAPAAAERETETEEQQQQQQHVQQWVRSAWERVQRKLGKAVPQPHFRGKAPQQEDEQQLQQQAEDGGDAHGVE